MDGITRAVGSRASFQLQLPKQLFEATGDPGRVVKEAHLHAHMHEEIVERWSGHFF